VTPLMGNVFVPRDITGTSASMFAPMGSMGPGASPVVTVSMPRSVSRRMDVVFARRGGLDCTAIKNVLQVIGARTA